MNMDDLVQAQKELRSYMNLLKEQMEEVLKTLKVLVGAKTAETTSTSAQRIAPDPAAVNVTPTVPRINAQGRVVPVPANYPYSAHHCPTTQSYPYFAPSPSPTAQHPPTSRYTYMLQTQPLHPAQRYSQRFPPQPRMASIHQTRPSLVQSGQTLKQNAG